ncbi:hypothetical protein MRBLWH7_000806 [Microbacterium sp. LWH7-1.2]|uniref:hypothetical protein n=1 Tax=Microbacterium sp. LWH7-1.2 TaxID=3135257 RepID=UPI0031398364
MNSGPLIGVDGVFDPDAMQVDVARIGGLIADDPDDDAGANELVRIFEASGRSRQYAASVADAVTRDVTEFALNHPPSSMAVRLNRRLGLVRQAARDILA